MDNFTLMDYGRVNRERSIMAPNKIELNNNSNYLLSCRVFSCNIKLAQGTKVFTDGPL